MDAFDTRGFLPKLDPLREFPPSSAYGILDTIGNSLPERLADPGFRDWADQLTLPRFDRPLSPETLPELRLYYLRLGFLASAYVNQTGQPRAGRLPASLAVPLCEVCRLLQRPPMLSYDGYALYNWYRLDKNQPIALGNIDTIQNFVPLYDEHWFILVHVEIEALAANYLGEILSLMRGANGRDSDLVTRVVRRITDGLRQQIAVLKRIPERMDPDLYFRTFRPYIRFFENVRYEGIPGYLANQRGETGAQSSVIPTLVAFFKIQHEPNDLTRHLEDMRRYMPASHRAFIDLVRKAPDIRTVANPVAFNEALEAIAEFRSVHYGWAREYIDERVDDPRGTGGTPFMQWLKQLIDETRAHRV